MVEKIQEANMDLLKSSPVNNKSVKVKFRDDLVSFEPDLTDDDVVSLESDHVNELPLDITPIQYKTEIINTDLTNIFDIVEEEDNEIIEEIETDYDNEVETAIAITKIEQSNNDSKDEITESNTISVENPTVSEKSSKRKRRKSSRKQLTREVNCRNHCLDKLDTNFSKLTIKDKPPTIFPPLKLRERKCCLETKTKFLPTYNGLRSEYGLSRLQLENRQKHLMLMKERERLREQLLNEYKKRRIEQNEAVFSQWLKDVARRKTNERQKLKTINRHCFTPNVICKKVGEERPKTANEICTSSGQRGVKSGGRKRPNSMHTSVYIEVPERVLRLGLQVGDLLVTDNNLLVKKLHILSFS